MPLVEIKKESQESNDLKNIIKKEIVEESETPQINEDSKKKRGRPKSS